MMQVSNCWVGLLLAVCVGLAGAQEKDTPKPLPPDPALEAFSEALYALDQDGNAATGWAVDTYSKNGKLFTQRVSPSVLAKPTYKTLIALFDNYNPTLGVAESVTPQEKQEEAAFLDAIMATPIMAKTLEFLKTRKLVNPATPAGLRALLQKIWFTLYRRRGQPDTSGFEHAFLGEVSGAAATANMDGFHNWVHLDHQEAANKTYYKSWKGQSDPDLYGMQFTWDGHLKYKSTIAIGESPEMSMAINTVCFLVAPNNNCNIKLGGAPASILTYRWDTKDPKEFYVASAYYN